MRRKSGIQKRPSSKMREVRIPIKKKTAENINTMNNVVAQKLAEVQVAQANLQNHVVSLITERGLPDATRVLRVTDEEPWELVVMVPK